LHCITNLYINNNHERRCFGEKIQSAITDEIFYALGLKFMGRDVLSSRRLSAGQFFFFGGLKTGAHPTNVKIYPKGGICFHPADYPQNSSFLMGSSLVRLY